MAFINENVFIAWFLIMRLIKTLTGNLTAIHPSEQVVLVIEDTTHINVGRAFLATAPGR